MQTQRSYSIIMGRTSFSGNDLTSRRDETIRTESSWERRADGVIGAQRRPFHTCREESFEQAQGKRANQAGRRFAPLRRPHGDKAAARVRERADPAKHKRGRTALVGCRRPMMPSPVDEAAPMTGAASANPLEATPGFEPGIKALQASALPLGHVALYHKRPAKQALV